MSSTTILMNWVYSKLLIRENEVYQFAGRKLNFKGAHSKLMLFNASAM